MCCLNINDNMNFFCNSDLIYKVRWIQGRCDGYDLSDVIISFRLLLL